MKKVAVSLVFVLATSSALAGGLSKKYKSWEKSPEAYFLTKSERAEWKQVKTDADAQNFILDYKAKRGPGFEKLLNERIAIADKYFSSGETKGSETLRGKVVIVFGPPLSIERDPQQAATSKADLSRINSVDAKGDGSALSNSGAPSPMGPHSLGAETPALTFVYDAEHAPKAIGKAFRAELKMYSAVDQEPADPRDLEEKFEAAAQGSVTAPETSSPR
ncbi:MAG: GWxTD domain-containing protein [Thermoanaerobaculia bacterium]